MQGDWSWGPDGVTSWFNSYGFFDAGAEAYVDVPWSLVDTTRGETLQASGTDSRDFSGSLDNTDSDGDGLPDWYERMIGTSLMAADTDGDGVSDFAEIQAGTNPRATSVTAIANATLSVFTPLE